MPKTKEKEQREPRGNPECPSFVVGRGRHLHHLLVFPRIDPVSRDTTASIVPLARVLVVLRRMFRLRSCLCRMPNLRLPVTGATTTTTTEEGEEE